MINPYKKLLEELSDLEHRQWIHWTKYMLDNLTTENIERWRRQCDIPYDQLIDSEKNSDREWAYKIIDKIVELDFVMVQMKK